MEKPATVRLSLDDGTVRDVSLELYERMKNVARDLADSAVVPSSSPGSGGVGNETRGAPNISDGSLGTQGSSLVPNTQSDLSSLFL